MTPEKTQETRSGERNLGEEPLSQIAAYVHQLNEYLESVGAKVEVYKFSIEKQDEALIVDVGIRASFHPKNRTGISE